MRVYLDLFLAFFRCGVFGFGGGQATVPLIEHEVVTTFNWLSVGEFSDAYALVNSLPGPITTKMAALVGFKMGGFLGSIIAIIGIILPSAIAVLILFSLYSEYKESKWMQGMMKGVRPVVVIMIGQVLYKVIKTAFNFSTFDFKLSVVPVGIAIVAAVVLIKFKVHPVFMIAASLIFGGLFL